MAAVTLLSLFLSQAHQAHLNHKTQQNLWHRSSNSI